MNVIGTQRLVALCRKMPKLTVSSVSGDERGSKLARRALAAAESRSHIDGLRKL